MAGIVVTFYPHATAAQLATVTAFIGRQFNPIDGNAMQATCFTDFNALGVHVAFPGTDTEEYATDVAAMVLGFAGVKAVEASPCI